MPAYEVHVLGQLHSPGRNRGSWNDTRVTNPSAKTRRMTVAWQAPDCKTTELSIRITNHYGRPIYDGKAKCDPFVVPIPAHEFVHVHLYGRGTYDVLLTLD